MIEAGRQDSNRAASLLRDAEVSLKAFVQCSPLNASAESRLAFRELGLSIGLHAILKMQGLIEGHPTTFSNPQELNARLSGLVPFLPMVQHIENFWLESRNQQSQSWNAHLDINNVMLATSLAPDGYLILK